MTTAGLAHLESFLNALLNNVHKGALGGVSRLILLEDLTERRVWELIPQRLDLQDHALRQQQQFDRQDEEAATLDPPSHPTRKETHATHKQIEKDLMAILLLEQRGIDIRTAEGSLRGQRFLEHVREEKLRLQQIREETLLDLSPQETLRLEPDHEEELGLRNFHEKELELQRIREEALRLQRIHRETLELQRIREVERRPRTSAIQFRGEIRRKLAGRVRLRQEDTERGKRGREASWYNQSARPLIHLPRPNLHCPHDRLRAWPGGYVCPDCHAWVGDLTFPRPPLEPNSIPETCRHLELRRGIGGYDCTTCRAFAQR